MSADRRARTSIALFTRDLRVHDNPVLAAACAEAEQVVPLFIIDPNIESLPSAGRRRRDFVTECLTDLDASLQGLGGRLVIRRGDPIEQACSVAEQTGADRVHIARDAFAYGACRERQLRVALARQRRELVVHDGVHTVVSPGQVTPTGSDHYAVFTPYWRRWAETPCRALVDPPPRIRQAPVAGERIATSRGNGTSALRGGEAAARERAARWLNGGVHRYHDTRDLLAADGTSRLSAYLHFGCLSALELASRAGLDDQSAGATAFVRQLAWRDFHAQVLAARPDAEYDDYRPRGDNWRDDADALSAWRDGRTGYPLVDAGMRQLAAEGWMHNRARLVTASFLSKSLYLDWRAGAAHFAYHLLDADIANNNLNWQWVAGTGTDTRPNRVLNPLRQAVRYDPDAQYVRRWLPELADLSAAAIHRLWRGGPARADCDYPAPLVDLDRARERFLCSRRPGSGGNPDTGPSTR